MSMRISRQHWQGLLGELEAARQQRHLVTYRALIERLQHPRVPSALLLGQKNRYKIKLRSSGYRLVYEVRDAEVVVLVVAVGKRERNAVYKAAAGRWVDD